MQTSRGVQFTDGWLRHQMNLRLLTNRQLAEATGLSPFTVSQACNGRVAKESAAKIFAALRRFPIIESAEEALA